MAHAATLKEDRPEQSLVHFEQTKRPCQIPLQGLSFLEGGPVDLESTTMGLSANTGVEPMTFWDSSAGVQTLTQNSSRIRPGAETFMLRRTAHLSFPVSKADAQPACSHTIKGKGRNLSLLAHPSRAQWLFRFENKAS